ncbi:hypothetical protein JCM19294_2271 [Nonlabens tegetincola]|uniref:TraB/GumN family protein n=1 Tax=Nonlabens tegetincola TaxID=323273 RepID=A0A090PXE0_9FLAO|nr:hypothetical protein JCM19294_2271 [Nonlabens tegetincola]
MGLQAICLLSFLFFFSCSKAILNSKATHAREIKVFQKGDREILYLGTTHIAKPSFFQEMKMQIDSLRDEGYVFFKEGVYFEQNTAAGLKDTLQRKFRQLMGLTIGDYTDKNNKTLPKFYSDGDYLMQTDSLLGLNKTDRLVDLSYNKMINLHEEKYGAIRLTKCDWQTDLYDKYECKDGNALKKSFYVVDIARTEHLFNELLKSENKKIAVVYGAGHFKWLYPDMLKAGFNYKNKRLSFK